MASQIPSEEALPDRLDLAEDHIEHLDDERLIRFIEYAVGIFIARALHPGAHAQARYRVAQDAAEKGYQSALEAIAEGAA